MTAVVADLPLQFRASHSWKTTAVCWLAEDPDTGVHYVYSAYARGNVDPVIHAEAIKARGKSVTAIDPASRGRTQKDGDQLFALHANLGLDLPQQTTPSRPASIQSGRCCPRGSSRASGHVSPR